MPVTPESVTVDDSVRLITNTKIAASLPWPEDCYVQGGGGYERTRDDGTVQQRKFFVEISPMTPQTFIRGEGTTMAAAEKAAWDKLEKAKNCPHADAYCGAHEPEPRGYRNGAGFCKHCNLFMSKIFTPDDLGLFCAVCEKPTFWSHVDEHMFCEEHEPDLEYAHTIVVEILDGKRPASDLDWLTRHFDNGLTLYNCDSSFDLYTAVRASQQEWLADPHRTAESWAAGKPKSVVDQVAADGRARAARFAGEDH